MRVMGIDPGTLKMGVGIIENKNNVLVPIWYTTVAISGKLHIHIRLQKIFKESAELIEKWRPDVIALEDIYYGASFKSAIRIGEARAAVILAAAEKQIAVIEYPPTRVKNAVSGFGRAAKVQVQHMVQHILHLDEMPPSDTADALAVAICHINTHAGKQIRKKAYV